MKFIEALIGFTANIVRNASRFKRILFGEPFLMKLELQFLPRLLPGKKAAFTMVTVPALRPELNV